MIKFMKNGEKVAATSLNIFFSLFLSLDPVRHPVWIRELCFGVAGAEKFRIRNMGEDKVSAALRVFWEALKALQQSVMAVVKVIIRGNNETIHRFFFAFSFSTWYVASAAQGQRKRKKVAMGLLRIYNVFKHIWGKSDTAEATNNVSVAQVIGLFLTHNRKAFFVYTNKSSEDVFMINAFS